MELLFFTTQVWKQHRIISSLARIAQQGPIAPASFGL
jgi:hypothetical protein